MAKIGVPYFDGTEVEFEEAEDLDGNAPDEAALRATRDAFLSLTPADRLVDTRHVHAYYQDVRQAIGGTDWLDGQMGVPEDPEDIWAHVTPSLLLFARGRGGDPHHYIVMEGECDWEEEHGLMMVWRDGKALCKVGGYDGHLTNAEAYDDAALGDVVHAGMDRAFRTRARG